ncbi:dihydrofolate reductase family protein [Microbacterium sp. JZ70]
MRRLIVSVLVSADGFFEGPEHDLAVMPVEDAFNDHNLDLLRSADTIVYGSRWFRLNWDTWAAVAESDDSGARDREIAARVLALEAIIVSDSFAVRPEDPWAATTRVVPRAEATAEIARLKQAEGRDIIMFGSSTTWNPLLAHGLVDELILLVGPALVGGGSPLYRGAPAPLLLRGARVLPGSQLVAITYTPAS